MKSSAVYTIAKEYEKRCEKGKIRVFDLEIKGKCKTLNILKQIAKYEWIAIIDVDDIWRKEKLRIQCQYMNYDVIGTKAMYIGKNEGFVPNLPVNDITKIPFFLCNPIINSSVVMKTELCYWNPDFEEGIEDFELWLRLQKEGRTFFNCEGCFVKHRVHDSSYFNTQNHIEKHKKLLEMYST